MILKAYVILMKLTCVALVAVMMSHHMIVAPSSDTGLPCQTLVDCSARISVLQLGYQACVQANISCSSQQAGSSMNNAC